MKRSQTATVSMERVESFTEPGTSDSESPLVSGALRSHFGVSTNQTAASV